MASLPLLIGWVALAGASGPSGASLKHISIDAPSYSAAVEQGNVPAACETMVEHFASRDRMAFPQWLFDIDSQRSQGDSPYVQDEPERVMRNEFAFLAEYIPLGETIDWNARPGRGDREIMWWINRFFFLECLQETYARTGDERFPRHGIALMLDWIEKNPIEQAEKAWAAWRTLEIGLRLASWSEFIDFVAAERIIDPGELAVVLESLREQTAYLQDHSGPRRGNWGFMEQAGIMTVAAVFPEFQTSRRWAEGVLQTYRIDVGHQFYPDGAQEELSPHYEHTVVRSLAIVLYLARQRGCEIPPELTGALRRAAAYEAMLTRPDGTLPMFNDGDAIDVRLFLRHLADEIGIPQVRAVLDDARDAEVPAACRLFPCSGVVLMRSGWDTDALCLYMEAGPFGTSHQHEDALGLDVSAYGRAFIVDPGRYTYAGGPMQAYLNGTRAHATITVDGGLQQRRKNRSTWRAKRPLTGQFAANDRLAWGAGVYDSGYTTDAARDVRHVREVVFVDQRYWIICDTLLGEGRHRIGRHFQYKPAKLRVEADRAVTQFDDANLVLLWSRPEYIKAAVHTGEKDPHTGWYSRSYLRVEPAPQLVLTAELDLPATLYTVLYPYRGRTTPRLSFAVDKASKSSVTVRQPERTDRIRFIQAAAPAATRPVVSTSRINVALGPESVALECRNAALEARP